MAATNADNNCSQSKKKIKAVKRIRQMAQLVSIDRTKKGTKNKKIINTFLNSVVKVKMLEMKKDKIHSNITH